jgi:hypothetical protein
MRAAQKRPSSNCCVRSPFSNPSKTQHQIFKMPFGYSKCPMGLQVSDACTRFYKACTRVYKSPCTSIGYSKCPMGLQVSVSTCPLWLRYVARNWNLRYQFGSCDGTCALGRCYLCNGVGGQTRNPKPEFRTPNPETLTDADCGACGPVTIHVHCKEKYCRQQGRLLLDPNPETRNLKPET